MGLGEIFGSTFNQSHLESVRGKSRGIIGNQLHWQTASGWFSSADPKANAGVQTLKYVGICSWSQWLRS